MKSTLLSILVPAMLLATFVSVVGAELSPQEVQDAMHKGVAYLKNKWRDNGNWSEYGGQEGGVTSLCALALLNAGEKPGLADEHLCLHNALEKVARMRPTTTYVVGLQTMVLCRVDDPSRYQNIIAHNVQWLQDTQIIAPQSLDRKGGWSYGENALVGQRAAAPGDGSNSQFALWRFTKRPARPRGRTCTSPSAERRGDSRTSTGPPISDLTAAGVTCRECAARAA